MKILIVHNEYGIYTGEEAAVDNLYSLLQSNGHRVSFYRESTAGRRSGIVNKLNAFFSGIYSYHGIKALRALLRSDPPDVINVNNLFPFISPPALFACKDAGIPVIMTVHNYRLICPTGLFMRNNMPCEECLTNKNEWGCIRHNCEKDMPKSIAHAVRSYSARQTGAYYKNVDRFTCLTAFQKRKLVEGGFEADKITVIPNCINVQNVRESSSGEYIAYIGRLSLEKGWDLLIDIAKRDPQLLFCVAGSEGHLKGPDQVIPQNVHIKGFLNKKQIEVFYSGASFIVMPSRCYEGLPMVLLEAMAAGKPIIAPEHGGFTEIIGKGIDAVGLLFRPGDIDDLEAKVLRLWNDRELVSELSKNALRKFSTSYSTEIIYKQWERLLNEVTGR